MWSLHEFIHPNHTKSPFNCSPSHMLYCSPMYILHCVCVSVCYKWWSMFEGKKTCVFFPVCNYVISLNILSPCIFLQVFFFQFFFHLSCIPCSICTRFSKSNHLMTNSKRTVYCSFTFPCCSQQRSNKHKGKNICMMGLQFSVMCSGMNNCFTWYL